MRYEVVKSYSFPPEAIGGITGGAVLLVLVSVVILLISRRKSTQAEREYKRIQIQMDTLESNVRSECKQGRRRAFFSYSSFSHPLLSRLPRGTCLVLLLYFMLSINGPFLTPSFPPVAGN